MRQRRIILDTDEHGNVLGWSATIYNRDGQRVLCQVCPVCPPEMSTPYELLNDLLGFEPDIQLMLPLGDFGPQDDELEAAYETSIPARNCYQE